MLAAFGVTEEGFTESEANTEESKMKSWKDRFLVISFDRLDTTWPEVFQWTPHL